MKYFALSLSCVINYIAQTRDPERHLAKYKCKKVEKYSFLTLNVVVLLFRCLLQIGSSMANSRLMALKS